ncbi:hypothetical protein KCP73_16275 [Salmonella enterica subsp. enterica]|nr:hypothetical protein KCP73_16275 [Salmonella enterica subsp. enterica]
MKALSPQRCCCCCGRCSRPSESVAPAYFLAEDEHPPMDKYVVNRSSPAKANVPDY